MANRRRLLAPFERKRRAGHHQHASIAHALCQVNRDPFHGRPYFSTTVLVTSARGFDLDDPLIPRQPDGPTTRPPAGGLGCSACADNVNMRSP
eukprot:5985-Pyramimonas_sp.AAC.1